MTDLRALWVAALLCAATATAQARSSADVAAKEPARDAAPAPIAEPDTAPARRLKFKGRAGNCLCADPITEDEIDAAAARQSEAKTKTTTPRSKP